jgi:hypothetical protein
MSNDEGVCESTRELLIEGGCDVVRCKETPASTFVCRGFVGHCPIDDGVAAAVVTGDGLAGVHPEDGASCAVRRRVPLVVAGDLAGHPYGQWAAAEVRDPRRHLLTALAEVTSGASTSHSEVAQQAAMSLVRRWGDDRLQVRVAVYRSEEGRLDAEVVTSCEVSPDLSHNIADRVRSRLRDYDAEAPFIDVSVRVGAMIP